MQRESYVMKILTVDVGTGTQDIFLFDSRLDIENGYKLILPSPTMIVHRRIKEATRRGEAILLSGVTMGGGPSQWAAMAHVKRGYPLYATPQAARSFNDDLDEVRSMGIQIVSEDEAQRLQGSVHHIELRDFDPRAMLRMLEQFGVAWRGLSAIAVAVFDHGFAPKGYSDRQFRFDYLHSRLQVRNHLSSFAFRPEEIPPAMTRMQAVVLSARNADLPGLEHLPMVVMDTAPAAILGATFDPLVRQHEEMLIANIGNFHTLAFRMRDEQIEGLFEHHTGLIDLHKLEYLINSLAEGTLTHAEVFQDHGHGALILNPRPLKLAENPHFDIVVTGPRRNMMRHSRLRTHFAVPFGDMMISGCFGLLAATAKLFPELGEPILAALHQTAGEKAPPWEVE